jgi:hypothetical protein
MYQIYLYHPLFITVFTINIPPTTIIYPRLKYIKALLVALYISNIEILAAFFYYYSYLTQFYQI